MIKKEIAIKGTFIFFNLSLRRRTMKYNPTLVSVQNPHTISIQKGNEKESQQCVRRPYIKPIRSVDHGK
jgi:hypothetical protein